MIIKVCEQFCFENSKSNVFVHIWAWPVALPEIGLGGANLHFCLKISHNITLLYKKF
jgi:hypothetical protein